MENFSGVRKICLQHSLVMKCAPCYFCSLLRETRRQLTHNLKKVSAFMSKISLQGTLALIGFYELLKLSRRKSESLLRGLFQNTINDMALSMSKCFSLEKFGTPTIKYIGKIEDLYEKGSLFSPSETPANVWEPYKATSSELTVFSPHPSCMEKIEFLNGRHRTSALEISNVATADLFIACQTLFLCNLQELRYTAYRRSILTPLVAEWITDVLSAIPSHINDIEVLTFSKPNFRWRFRRIANLPSKCVETLCFILHSS